MFFWEQFSEPSSILVQNTSLVNQPVTKLKVSTNKNNKTTIKDMRLIQKACILSRQDRE